MNPKLLGWVTHAYVGEAVALPAQIVGITTHHMIAGAWLGLWTTLVAFAFHEWADGDFLPANGGPWNGIIDVATSLGGPLLVILVMMLI